MPLTFLTILIAIILRISVTSRVLRTLFFSPFYSPLLPPPTQCRDEKSLRRYCLGSSPFISKIDQLPLQLLINFVFWFWWMFNHLLLERFPFIDLENASTEYLLSVSNWKIQTGFVWLQWLKQTLEPYFVTKKMKGI